MYYKCKIYPTDVVVYVKENEFGVIVGYLLTLGNTPLITGYLSEDEVKAETNNCYVEFKCNR